ncbi:MAG: NAD(P)H-hydrate dehydratase [Bacteroidia bacterium]|nr:NAD(P)H-hydrate dehydratase [Bacteroidia bacterium]
MHPIATAAQIREADRIQITEKYVPGLLLMEQAGRMAADKLCTLYPGQGAFLILAGPGNNGGDGLVIARYLCLWGREVQVILSHEPGRFEGDARIMHQILSELPVPLTLFEEADIQDIVAEFREPPVLVDALLGTGSQGPLRGSVLALIQAVSALTLPVVAIDLPSGLDADTGDVPELFLPATHTLTFQLAKVCHCVTPAATACGTVTVLDIGIWPEVIRQLGIQRFVPERADMVRWRLKREATSHKGTFGHALAIGGSRYMPGAIALTGYACLQAGAGLVSVFTPEACRTPVFALAPELMCPPAGAVFDWLGPDALEDAERALAGKAAVMIGPGMGTHPETYAFLARLLPRIQVPLVVDADALNLLAAHPDLWLLLPSHTILTPHPGEMARLTGLTHVQERRLETAERLAQDRQVIVILKGAGTLIACPDGTTFVNPTGNPGMATAGSGDVLTGILGGLLAQGYSPQIAAVMGVYLHGLAGDLAAGHLGQEGVTARALAAHFRIPERETA